MKKKYKKITCVIACVCVVGLLAGGVYAYKYFREIYSAEKQVKELIDLKQETVSATEMESIISKEVPADEAPKPVILTAYKSLYEANPDIIGWLKIEDTVIDYPVMQTMDDEEFYLHRDFYGKDNTSGCLILDTDSQAGVGTLEYGYIQGEKPSTNLIIHGHTMKSGKMFGGLSKYADEKYGKSHSVIKFDTLYEKREYELIAVFYSQVFKKTDEVFKYYKFFQADTQEEFDDWYNNIKEMSLYDTGVEAQLGDEFITLSCCAYHAPNGRFVVVGRRKRD